MANPKPTASATFTALGTSSDDAWRPSLSQEDNTLCSAISEPTLASTTETSIFDPFSVLTTKGIIPSPMAGTCYHLHTSITC
ncbi:hypothetical protein APHAL10511_003126 [Amanita phalloides]|nr:hypothetical protein APHAL10511_003126 [Amanita phalloides]